MRSQVSPRSVENYREVDTININPLLGNSRCRSSSPARSPRHGVTHRIDKMSETIGTPAASSTGAATATGRLERASGWMIRQDLPETSSEERKERKATEKEGSHVAQITPPEGSRPRAVARQMGGPRQCRQGRAWQVEDRDDDSSGHEGGRRGRT